MFLVLQYVHSSSIMQKQVISRPQKMVISIWKAFPLSHPNQLNTLHAKHAPYMIL